MAIPQTVYDSADFIGLSGSALRLLIDIYTQYNGKNNGDLTAAMSVLKERGWTSRNGLNKSLQELLDARLLVRTREGQFPKLCALYAVTWHNIDECQGKLLNVDPTATPVRKFSLEVIQGGKQ